MRPYQIPRVKTISPEANGTPGLLSKDIFIMLFVTIMTICYAVKGIANYLNLYIDTPASATDWYVDMF